MRSLKSLVYIVAQFKTAARASVPPRNFVDFILKLVNYHWVCQQYCLHLCVVCFLCPSLDRRRTHLCVHDYPKF